MPRTLGAGTARGIGAGSAPAVTPWYYVTPVAHPGRRRHRARSPARMGAMRVSPRALFASPAFPWVTGGLLTFLVVPEVRRMDAMSPVILASTFAATLPLIWRRSHPVVAYASAGGSLLSWLVWEQLWATALVAGSLGFFTLARRRVANPFVLAVGGRARRYSSTGSGCSAATTDRGSSTPRTSSKVSSSPWPSWPPSASATRCAAGGDPPGTGGRSDPADRGSTPPGRSRRTCGHRP
ncbi:hypothetical protein NKH18_25715 [Streptomyces sp. M10(2022)]